MFLLTRYNWKRVIKKLDPAMKDGWPPDSMDRWHFEGCGLDGSRFDKTLFAGDLVMFTSGILTDDDEWIKQHDLISTSMPFVRWVGTFIS